MKLFPILLVLALFGTLLAACSDDDANAIGRVKIDKTTMPTLVLINASGVATNSGEPIGIVPAIETNGARAVFGSFSPRQAATPKLLKDLPFKTLAAASRHKATRAPAPGITDSTTTYTFSALNADENAQVVTVNATRRALGTNCIVFVENGEESTHNWQAVANLFDTQVWPKNTERFGTPTDVDSNGLIVILYFKMRDNNNAEVPNTLGYFFSEDLITTGTPYSNNMEIFYMNLAFGEPLDSEMQRTLFHEFQHMINYGQRVVRTTPLPEMDVWINEGLAESAEHNGLGTAGTSRIDAMNADADGKLGNGYPLVIWQGDEYAYGLSYTFMQYLRIQADTWDIMGELIANAYGDYRGLEAVINPKVPALGTFDKMLEGYNVAKLRNEPTGVYGFKGESAFTFTLYSPTSQPTASDTLYPGGCVFIPTSATKLSAFELGSGAGSSIKYFKHTID